MRSAERNRESLEVALANPVVEVRDEIKPISDQNTIFLRSGGKVSQITFAVSEKFIAKLDRVKELMGGSPNLETVIGGTLDLYIQKHCPKERLQRRAARQQTHQNHDITSRHIPARIRDDVFNRDGFQCTFVGEPGNRCQCRKDLELDHIIRVARALPLVVANRVARTGRGRAADRQFELEIRAGRSHRRSTHGSGERQELISSSWASRRACADTPR